MAACYTLHPGDVACGERGDRLETLLGSCIAIVLTDPRRTVGAMCHVVHTGTARDSADPQYGHAALAAMYDLLIARGITPRLCEAFVYGGGNMFPAHAGSGHVGERNARWALQALQAQGVRVRVQDLGGSAYRKLVWTVGPGDPEVQAKPIEEPV